jgi:hypothetical protein
VRAGAGAVHRQRRIRRRDAPYPQALGFGLVDPYLEDRHGFMFGAFDDTTTSDLLSKARGSYWLALPPLAATRLLDVLQEIDLNLPDLLALITSERALKTPRKRPWPRKQP